MKIYHLVLMSLIFLITVQSASAWCFANIGNTCADASRETGIIKKYFNLNKPAPSDEFDIFSIKKTTKNIFDSIFKPKEDTFKPDNPFDSPIKNTGDKLKSTDIEGESVITTFTKVSKVQVGTEEPWYYDLDISSITGHQCIGCPTTNPDIPGFDYEFIIVLRNTGNVAVDDGFTIEVIGEDLENGNLYYNEVVHRPGFPVGTGTIPIKLYDIGLSKDKKTLEENSVFKGVFDSPELPLQITVRLKNDDKQVEPGFVEYEKKTRNCKTVGSGEDATTKCTTETKIVRKTFNAEYNDPSSDDQQIYKFDLYKLTPELISDANLKLNIFG